MESSMLSGTAVRRKVPRSGAHIGGQALRGKGAVSCVLWAVSCPEHRGPREERPHCSNSKLRPGVPSARSPGSATQLAGLGGKGGYPL